MAVLIKGMQMPDNCEDCPCGYETEGVYRDECQVLSREWEKDATSNRPDWCPLVEIPKGARLIDANKISSRRAAIVQLSHNKTGDDDCDVVIQNDIETIKALPSAEPERKKGKWIYGEKSGQDGWYCSECGGFIPWYYDFYGLDNIDFIEDFKTCPFCDSKMVSYTGGDMRGEEDE